VTGAPPHLTPPPAPLHEAPPSLEHALGETLREIDASGLRRPAREFRRLGGGRLIVDGREVLDFASNDYLGLATDRRLATAMADAAANAGTGAGAARLITGTHPLHSALEHELAELTCTEAALLFTSGYAANTGVIPALVGDGDVIYSDELAHASLIDGCRLSRARICIVPHGNADALEAMLRANAGSARRSLIVVEGIYSMDGDRAPLDRIAPLARRFGAWLMLDDAHGIGVSGPDGRGSSACWSLGQRPEITVGTLGKAFGVAGAFVSGSRTLIEFLRHRARSFVFSTAPAPPLAAAALEALRVARGEDWRRTRLAEHARSVRERLRANGRQALGDADSAIVPVPIGDPGQTMRAAAALEREGFLVGAIRPPTVPAGTSRLRITLSAAHDARDVDRLCSALLAALTEVGA
jgi:8-amino-7-oxononanoate synthase